MNTDDKTSPIEDIVRLRRKQLVTIPSEWVGKTTHRQTIRKRRSKQSASIRRGWPAHFLKDGTWPKKEYREQKYAMVDDEA